MKSFLLVLTEKFSPQLLAVLFGCMAIFFVPSIASSVTFGLQSSDYGCGGAVWGAGYTANGWSGHIWNYNYYELDCIRLYIDSNVAAQTNVRLGILLLDYACDPYSCWAVAGGAVTTPWASQGGGWSGVATDNDAYNFDGAQIYIEYGSMPGWYVQTLQAGIQILDIWGLGGCDWAHAGSAQWTPASYGWSPWAADSDATDPNCVRIHLSAPLVAYAPDLYPQPLNLPATFNPGSTNIISNAIGVTNGGIAAAGAHWVRIYWDYNRDGYTGTNGDFYSDHYVAGVASGATAWQSLSLNFNASQAGNWRATMQVDVNGNVAEGNEGNNATVRDFVVLPGAPSGLAASCNATGDQVTLSWNSTTGATGYYPRIGFASGVCPSGWALSAPTTCYRDNYAGTSIAVPVTLNTPYTWWVHAGNAGGAGGSTSGNFTCTVPPPTATLEVRNVTTGGAWQSSNLSITDGNQIEMRWSSTDTTSCSKSFTTGTAVSGGPLGVTEPTVGNTTTYTLSCTGPGGSTARQIDVRSYSSIPLLEASRENVRLGDTITFTWDTYLNSPASCTFEGPDAPGTLATAQGTVDIVIDGVSTFTLTCPTGSAEVTIKITPRLYES